MVERLDSPAPAELVRKVEELRARHPVQEQAIRWRREHWATDKLAEFQVVLDGIAKRCKDEGGHLLIDRRQVFELADGDVVELFLAAMVWGHGTVGYGPDRVGDVVLNAGSDLWPRLERQRDAAQLGPENAWTSFRVEDRLFGLGPAFASKFAYFSSFERSNAAVKPLIVDLNTSWAMWDLVCLRRSVELPDTYVRYVEIAHRWARDHGWRPDDVEWALFEIGKDVKRTASGDGGTDEA